MEGFICPECKESFQTAALLQDHFPVHFEETSPLKSMMSRAKDYTMSWIANEEVTPPAPSPSSPRPPSRGPPSVQQWEDVAPQVVGVCNNLTKVFKAVRPKRLSHSQKEATKLHIRLDKLVTALVSEIAAGNKNLREVEQRVVPWFNESEGCTGCGLTGTILRLRKHHCRLCAELLCSDCSQFVELEQAIVSLGKDLPPNPVQHSLRLCEKCLNIIASAREEAKLRNADHTVEDNYRKLMDAKEKCDKLITSYTKMHKSICAGKVRYSLDEGNSARVELIKQFKVVDTLSERVAVARSTSPAQQKVQAHIKAAFRSYLQDHLHTTSPLPELKELKDLQETRVEENRAVVQGQKEAALRTQNLSPTTSPRQHSGIPQQTFSRGDSWSTRSVAKDSTALATPGPSWDEGWSGEQQRTVAQHSHPLIEQREIIRGYLRQAIRDNRKEEIETLKQNLLMIVNEISALGLD